VIAAFPYSLAFSADTVEVRSPINGSLLQTLNMPKLNLIASKEDIFFTTTKVVSDLAYC
jgi:CNH domain